MLDVFFCLLPAPFQLSASQLFSVSPSRHRPGPDFSVSVFQHLSFQFLLSAFPISAFPQVPHDAHRTSSNLRSDPFPRVAQAMLSKFGALISGGGAGGADGEGVRKVP